VAPHRHRAARSPSPPNPAQVDTILAVHIPVDERPEPGQVQRRHQRATNPRIRRPGVQLGRGPALHTSRSANVLPQRQAPRGTVGSLERLAARPAQRPDLREASRASRSTNGHPGVERHDFGATTQTARGPELLLPRARTSSRADLGQRPSRYFHVDAPDVGHRARSPRAATGSRSSRCIARQGGLRHLALSAARVRTPTAGRRAPVRVPVDPQAAYCVQDRRLQVSAGRQVQWATGASDPGRLPRSRPTQRPTTATSVRADLPTDTNRRQPYPVGRRGDPSENGCWADEKLRRRLWTASTSEPRRRSQQSARRTATTSTRS
jgi:hypothetical protein